jgi:hypothetical protein
VVSAPLTGKDGAVSNDGQARWCPDTDEEYELVRAELKARFAAWAAEKAIAVDREAPESPLHYKWGFLDGHLTRWTRDDLNELYLELHPAKVIAEAEELGDVMEEAKAFIAFLAETDLLDPGSEPADVLIDHLERIEGRFRAHMADASRHSFGKRFWLAASAEGVRPDDPEAMEAFMARFNARPRDEREAVLGPLPAAPRPPPSGRFTPPGTRPRHSSAKRRKRRR